MKHSCKTCDHFDDYGNCWKGAPFCLDIPHPRKSVDPACSAWVLKPGTLTTAFRASLDKAREKHPVFLDAWPEAEDAEAHLAAAKMWKEAIANKDSGQLRAVLYSEVEEFLAEVARGDFDRAISEAGDVVAVLYRALDEACKEEQEDAE